MHTFSDHINFFLENTKAILNKKNMPKRKQESKIKEEVSKDEDVQV